MNLIYYMKHDRPSYQTYLYISLHRTSYKYLPTELHTIIYKHCYNDVLIELQTLFFDYQDHLGMQFVWNHPRVSYSLYTIV